MVSIAHDLKKMVAMGLLVALVALAAFVKYSATDHSSTQPAETTPTTEVFTTPPTFPVSNAAVAPEKILVDLLKTRNHAFQVADASLVSSYAASGTSVFAEEQRMLADLHARGLHYGGDYVEIKSALVIRSVPNKSITVDVLASAKETDLLDGTGNVKGKVTGFSDTTYAYSLINDSGNWKIIAVTQIYPDDSLNAKIRAAGIPK